MAGDAHCVAGDVTEAAHRTALLTFAAAELGRSRRAGEQRRRQRHGPVSSSDEATLRRIMEVNFFAPTELTRLALPLLRAGGGRRS